MLRNLFFFLLFNFFIVASTLDFCFSKLFVYLSVVGLAVNIHIICYIINKIIRTAISARYVGEVHKIIEELHALLSSRVVEYRNITNQLEK